MVESTNRLSQNSRLMSDVVLVTNDDGGGSPGIRALTKIAKNLGDVVVAAPLHQSSGTGKGLSFLAPFKILDRGRNNGTREIVFDGTPACALSVAEYYVNLPSIVVSGINEGDNTSWHSILTSGTCGAVMESGFYGIPSFAISVNNCVENVGEAKLTQLLEMAGNISLKLIKKYLLLDQEFWEKTLFVNINFPADFSEKTPIRTSNVGKQRFKNRIEREITDGYHRLQGIPLPPTEEGTDVYEVFVNKTITISAISLVPTTLSESFMNSFNHPRRGDI